MNPVQTERGMALPAVVFTLAIMAVMASVAFRTADDERRAAWAAKESGVALYAAEAGLRATMANWPGTEPMMAPGATLDLGWRLLPNKSSYHATIQRVDRGGLQAFAVVVEAKSRGAQGGRTRISGMVSAVPTFSSGIFAEGDVTLTGGSSTDSYNSSLAPYNPAAPDSGGSVSTNGNITLSGSPTNIKGDATARGTVSAGLVTGTVTSNAPSFPAQEIKTCPSGGFTPAAYLPSGSGISYNATTGALSVPLPTVRVLLQQYLAHRRVATLYQRSFDDFRQRSRGLHRRHGRQSHRRTRQLGARFMWHGEYRRLEADWGERSVLYGLRAQPSDHDQRLRRHLRGHYRGQLHLDRWSQASLRRGAAQYTHEPAPGAHGIVDPDG
jgi:hypothetical protein